MLIPTLIIILKDLQFTYSKSKSAKDIAYGIDLPLKRSLGQNNFFHLYVEHIVKKRKQI